MKHFEKITTRAELDDYLKNGISGDAYRLLGCYRVSFYPYETIRTDEEHELVDTIATKDDGDYIEIPVCAVSGFVELEFSTVYHSMRFYFKNGEDLKRFCEIVEG